MSKTVTTTKDLIEHRTKLLMMKADMICKLRNETNYSGWLDHDIKECDRLIELLIIGEQKNDQ